MSRPIVALTLSGVDGVGVGDAQPLGDEASRRRVDDGGLDPAAADVDADRERSDGVRPDRCSSGLSVTSRLRSS